MDPRLYELATVAVATAIRSSYCSLVHGRILATSYYPPGAVASIAAVDTGDAPDAADDAVVRFARKVAEEADKITQEDIGVLRGVGFSDADVFNIILVAAGRCSFSKVLDATGTLPDTALQDIPDPLRSALTVGRDIAHSHDRDQGGACPRHRPSTTSLLIRNWWQHGRGRSLR
jgi:hypothetical protein